MQPNLNKKQYFQISSKLPFFNEDIWDASWLGLRVNKHRNASKLSFSHIQQPWLKLTAKKFIEYASTNKQVATLQSYTSVINDFSYFLALNYPDLKEISEISRCTITDYLCYLNSKDVSAKQRGGRLSILKALFETGTINKWFEVPSHLIHQEDYPKRLKALPRYIPEDIMLQLNQHLHELPEPVMRAVLVLQECGFRIGELLQLKIDCLKQDSKGDYYIQYMNWKMSRESTKPISLECAATIKEQKQYIQDKFGNQYEYLFGARKQYSKAFICRPKIMDSKSFINFLKRLAEEFDIKDNSGKRWNFQTHQFRHTVGTRMINNGVPQHIIQRYLDHDSPAMTSVYAHIHDETLRREIEKYHETRVVDIAGKLVELEQSSVGDDENIEWFKKNVLAMALPQGWCGRPKVLGHCNLPPNSCLDCAPAAYQQKFP